MNWTEGKLARHSRARQTGSNKQSVLRQKEHFAKARAGQVPSTSKKTPPSFSEYFQPPAAHRPHQPALFSPPQPLNPTAGSSQNRLSAGKRRRATPSPRHHEARALPGLSHPQVSSHSRQDRHDPVPAADIDENTVYEKRRRLLRDHDWAGISMQKPIPVNFTEDVGGRKWGRRPDGVGSKHMHVLGECHGQARKDNGNIATPYRQQGVKITIGSQQVRLGHPSSTTRASRVSGSQTVVSVPQDRPKTYQGVPMRRTFAGSSSSITDPRERLNRRMRPPERHPSIISISNSSRSQHVEDVRRRHEGLQAPIPIRHFPHLEMSLTRQIDHDGADSMLAQVGMQTSPISADRKEENEVWRRCVAPLQSTNGSVDRNTIQPRVSPGVSAHRHQALSSTASRDEPSVEFISDSFASGQESSSYVSRRLDDLSSIPEESVRNVEACSGYVEQSSTTSHNGTNSPALHTPSDPSRGTISHWDSYDSSSPAADSPDQYLAGVHDYALDVVSQHMSRRNEESEKGTASGGSLDGAVTCAKASPLEHIDNQIPETAAVRSPERESNDIWYNFVFSDTNTEDLHKQVLVEAQEESARTSKALRTTSGGRRKADQSEWGYNMSTTATVGQPSIGASEVGDDLTSVPEACASHKAAFGSPVTTLTSGTIFHDWDGSGGPPYAAPSTYAEAAPGSTTSAYRESNDSMSTGGVMALGSSDAASIPASLAVEPPQSVANNASARESFIFAPPKLFVGRLAEPATTSRPITAVKPVTMTKPRRGRSKNRTRDGRLDIRSIPKYEDDPIEDFDEPGVEPRVQPSLFGSLETE